MAILSNKDVFRLKGVSRGRPTLGPRLVNIHLTNTCDRHCLFCWYFSPLVSWNEKRKDLEFDVLKRVVDDCSRMGVDEINLEGGEVVLYPRVREAFDLVSRSGMKLSAYTHLAYGSEYLDFLWKADSLDINLSAATRKVYYKIHGADRFNDVLSNLRILAKVRKIKKKLKLRLTFIVHRFNYTQIPAFLELAEAAGVDEVCFRLFEATVEMKGLVFAARSKASVVKVVGDSLGRQWKIRHNLQEIYNTITEPQFLKGHFSIPRSRWNNDRYFYYNVLQHDVARCYIGWFYALINEKGQVVAPCDNVGACVAGNVYHDSFKEIWFNSRKFARIRHDALCGIDIRKRRWTECRYCGYASVNARIDQAFARGKKG